jgi:hypothetical protein
LTEQRANDHAAYVGTLVKDFAETLFDLGLVPKIMFALMKKVNNLERLVVKNSVELTS